MYVQVLAQFQFFQMQTNQQQGVDNALPVMLFHIHMQVYRLLQQWTITAQHKLANSRQTAASSVPGLRSSSQNLKTIKHRYLLLLLFHAFRPEHGRHAYQKRDQVASSHIYPGICCQGKYSDVADMLSKQIQEAHKCNSRTEAPQAAMLRSLYTNHQAFVLGQAPT